MRGELNELEGDYIISGLTWLDTTRRLMTVPGICVVTALTFRHTIDDPPASQMRRRSAPVSA